MKMIADWSDIQSLFTALHDDTRTTDAATWRTNLETVFDTDVFSEIFGSEYGYSKLGYLWKNDA